MLLARIRSVPRPLKPVLLAVLALAAVFCPAISQPLQAQSKETLPLSQVQPGMQGYACTIFAGDQVEKFDLQVIGIMPNFLGPRQSIILVQLKGPKVEHTGVVAGMSGSPVYLDGKLAGALSLKLGVFTKEPIAGVTPIQDVMGPPVQNTAFWNLSSPTPSSATVASNEAPGALTLPSGSALQPIDTPLVFAGFAARALQQFAPQFQGYGFVAAQGGTAAPRPDDKELVPGDMAGMVLVQGDASINSACTVTAIRADHVYLCGHPFMNLGNVQIPMARSRVLTTLSSDLASTKIVNVGGSIGTIIGDHLTAVTGKLGTPPPMVPLDLTVANGGTERKLHFDIVNHAKLTPLLVALTTFNGLTQNAIYSEGSTLRLSAEILLKGHAPVKIENTYAPGDVPIPDGLPIALGVQNIFSRLFLNDFEVPVVDHIALRVDSMPGRQSFNLESAWLEKSQVEPGETIRVRVLLHPYRGAPLIQETALRIPEQIAHGVALRIVVTDGDTFNRVSRGFAFPTSGAPTGLDQLIAVLNRERRNNRLYVGLFEPRPTLLWEDKELPSVPWSAINVIDGRRAPGSVQVLHESLAAESSLPLDGPVSGIITLPLQVR